MKFIYIILIIVYVYRQNLKSIERASKIELIGTYLKEIQENLSDFNDSVNLKLNLIDSMINESILERNNGFNNNNNKLLF